MSAKSQVTNRKSHFDYQQPIGKITNESYFGTHNIKIP